MWCIAYVHWLIYLQFTNNLVSVWRSCRCRNARFQTVQRYEAPSSFRVGVMLNIDFVGSSLFFPRMTVASNICSFPMLYHLIWGGGEPPTDEQVKFKGFLSVAVVTGDGVIMGIDGCNKTVKSMDLEWRTLPVPPSFNLHSNCPLSRSYVAFVILRSYVPLIGRCLTL